MDTSIFSLDTSTEILLVAVPQSRNGDASHDILAKNQVHINNVVLKGEL